MRGLDPRIHLCKIYAQQMDPRVKPAGDGGGSRAPIQIDRTCHSFAAH
jgi:hypothetical protein